MTDREILKDLARQFVAAENLGRDGGKEAADKILATDFLGITRAGKRSGAKQEESREELLNNIGSAEPNVPLRELHFADPNSDAWPIGEACWVVKGVVKTGDGSFRNMYVFKWQDDPKDQGWRLFSCQVTRLV
jgi:hypothetical protein